MPRKLLRRCLPSREKMAENAFLGWFGHWFADPRLWQLNRRSVAGGVAAGAIGGLIPGPLQIVTAAILSLIFRVNLPVAALTTFYSNPFTIGPLYWLAYKMGSFLSLGNGRTALPAMPSFSELGFIAWCQALAEWAWSLGIPLAIGLPALALSLAILGFFLVHLLWRLHVHWAIWQRARRTIAR